MVTIIQQLHIYFNTGNLFQIIIVECYTLPHTKVYVINVLLAIPSLNKTVQYKIIDMDATLQKLNDNYDFVTYTDCYSKFVGDNRYN